MNRTKRITTDAILAAAALLLFLVEAQIPAFIPIPGIKLGLANIATLVALHLFGKRDAAAVLFIRVMLGSVFSGNITTFAFSAGGGILCFFILCLLRHFGKIPLWVHSVFGAIAHNIGQLIVASFWMQTTTVFWYFPYLLLSAVICGSFTGLCAQFTLKYLKRGYFVL